MLLFVELQVNGESGWYAIINGESGMPVKVYMEKSGCYANVNGESGMPVSGRTV